MTISLLSDYVTVACGKDGCNQQFAMAETFYNQVNRTGETWYCPSGHPRCYRRGKTDAQKLAEAQARETHLKDQLLAAGVAAEQARVALIRDRHRFANGVCPCCNRYFANVHRHVRGEHPDYDVTKVDQARVATFKCSCGRRFESLRGLRTHQGHMRGSDWADPDTSATSSWHGSHLTVV